MMTNDNYNNIGIGQSQPRQTVELANQSLIDKLATTILQMTNKSLIHMVYHALFQIHMCVYQQFLTTTTIMTHNVGQPQTINGMTPDD